MGRSRGPNKTDLPYKNLRVIFTRKKTWLALSPQEREMRRFHEFHSHFLRGFSFCLESKISGITEKSKLVKFTKKLVKKATANSDSKRYQVCQQALL